MCVAKDRTSCWVRSNTCSLPKSSVQWRNKQTCVQDSLSASLSPRHRLPGGSVGVLDCKNVHRAPKLPSQLEAKAGAEENGCQRHSGHWVFVSSLCLFCVCGEAIPT